MEGFLKGRVTLFRSDLGFGFIESQDGRVFGFNLDQLASFGTIGRKFGFTGEKVEQNPKQGDPVRFSKGQMRNGEHWVEHFGFEYDYLKAQEEHIRILEIQDLLIIKLKREASAERLRVNPNFRLCQRRHFMGFPLTSKDILFIGTKKTFEIKLIRGTNIFGRRHAEKPHHGTAWFEQETASGWERISNPLDIDLPCKDKLTMIACRQWLSVSSVNISQRNYFWNFEGERVAMGIKEEQEIFVEFPENEWHASTKFEGNEALDLMSYGIPF